MHQANQPVIALRRINSMLREQKSNEKGKEQSETDRKSVHLEKLRETGRKGKNYLMNYPYPWV